MPRAKTVTAPMVKPGERRKLRIAYVRSCQRRSIHIGFPVLGSEMYHIRLLRWFAQAGSPSQSVIAARASAQLGSESAAQATKPSGLMNSADDPFVSLVLAETYVNLPLQS